MMFSKFMKFFEVKEDDTLNYMNPDKLTKTKQQPLKDPLNQDDEDEFFRQLEEEKRAAERKKASYEDDFDDFQELKITPPNRQKASTHTPPPEPQQRESVLKKMRQCMQERDWNPKHHPKIIVGIACTLIGSVILALLLRETPNPLLGKWQPQKKSNIFVPTGDIEFKKDQLLANGVTTPIKYNIEKQYVEVIDLTSKMHIPFYITGDKTIELNLLGVKTTYKKLDK